MKSIMQQWRELKETLKRILKSTRCENCDGRGIDPLEPEHGCNACDGRGFYKGEPRK